MSAGELTQNYPIDLLVPTEFFLREEAIESVHAAQRGGKLRMPLTYRLPNEAYETLGISPGRLVLIRGHATLYVERTQGRLLTDTLVMPDVRMRLEDIVRDIREVREQGIFGIQDYQRRIRSEDSYREWLDQKMEADCQRARQGVRVFN
jgi:hypothetical protein